MKPIYRTIEHMLDMIDEPNGSICKKILSDNKKLFQTVQGSSNNHQAWPGGYLDHVREIMNIAIVLYEKLNSIRPLLFPLSDLLLVLFFHDIEKPWKYELLENGTLQYKESMKTKADHQAFRITKLAEYGIVLTADQKNGIEYAKGEINDHSNFFRAMGPLATVAHMCDVASARLWFNYPLEENDPWTDAGRIRD